MSSETAIRITDLSKSYRIRHEAGDRPTNLAEVVSRRFRKPFQRASVEEFWALKEVNLDIKRGEVVGVIGRNGAGKSTLLKILSRITEPTRGRVELFGRVGSLLEVGTGFHPELTGRENIYLNGAILGMRRGEITRQFDAIVDFAGVERFLDTPVKRYSSGMYVRLAFAVAAHLNPEILIVDEVLAVGDTEFQKKCLGKMQDVAQSGRTVLFVSHNMAAVRKLCHSAVVLESGRVSVSGEVATVSDQYSAQVTAGAATESKVLPSTSMDGVTLKTCRIRLHRRASRWDAEIDLAGSVSNAISRFGIGFEVTTLTGQLAVRCWPGHSGIVLGSVSGPWDASVRIPDINRYLNGGDYLLSVTLHELRVKTLLRVESVASLHVPEFDLYETGNCLSAAEHGVVPLPIELTSPG